MTCRGTKFKGGLDEIQKKMNKSKSSVRAKVWHVHPFVARPVRAQRVGPHQGVSGSPRNASVQPNKWKRDGAIFAFQHRGIDYFPRYALYPVESYRP